MLLYKQVVPLSREAHMKFRLKPVTDFSFAKEVHWMPVAGAEFFQCSRYFPIVFVKENEGFRPIILLSLEVKNNEFVENGEWKQGAYIPAFVRRYPFMLANINAESKELTVCLDPTYDGWNEAEGRELFKQDGGNSEFLSEMLQFMSGFNVEMQRTTEFMKEINSLNLLVKRSVDIRSADGQTFHVQDLYMIDEEALRKLSGVELEKFNKAGMLGWIFAHLASLSNLSVLFDMQRARKAAA